jgi:hypothetical protein
MVEARMAATKYYTGSIDGEITCRSQLSRTAPDFADLTGTDEDCDKTSNLMMRHRPMTTMMASHTPRKTTSPPQKSAE